MCQEAGMKRYKLTDQQMAAVRMAVAGATPSEIARTIGVTPSTVSQWKKRYPDFNRAVSELQELAVSAAVEDAAHFRGKVLRTAELAVAKMTERLEQAHQCEECGTEPADLRELGSGLNALQSWYKTLSGQTGVVETSRVEAEVSVPDEARRLLRAQLERLDPSTLRAMEGEDE